MTLEKQLKGPIERLTDHVTNLRKFDERHGGKTARFKIIPPDPSKAHAEVVFTRPEYAEEALGAKDWKPKSEGSHTRFTKIVDGVEASFTVEKITHRLAREARASRVAVARN